MPSLPEEIIFDITSFLPVKSILRFRCVCKNWYYKLFKDPMFSKLHLDHATGNNKVFSLLTGRGYPMYSVNLCLSSSAQNNESVVGIDSPFPLDNFCYGTYGSCGGLILMHDPWKYPGVIIWNPSTKEIKEVPEPVPNQKNSTDVRFIHTRYGFGYSHLIDDYKIVKAEMSCDDDGTYRSEIKVYTLGSNSWISIPDVVPYELYLGGYDTKPVSINGVLYWIGFSVFHRVVIFAFDMEKNTFNEVPVNLELQESPGYDVSCFVNRSRRLVSSGEYSFLGIFRGYLSVVLQSGELDSSSNSDSDISIWVMKEYGVKDSWSKMLTITKQTLERSIQYSKLKVLNISMNGVVLFLKDETSLVLYEPKSETTRVMNISGLSEDWTHVETYVESLISLNSGTYLHLQH